MAECDEDRARVLAHMREARVLAVKWERRFYSEEWAEEIAAALEAVRADERGTAEARVRELDAALTDAFDATGLAGVDQPMSLIEAIRQLRDERAKGEAELYRAQTKVRQLESAIASHLPSRARADALDTARAEGVRVGLEKAVLLLQRCPEHVRAPWRFQATLAADCQRLLNEIAALERLAQENAV